MKGQQEIQNQVRRQIEGNRNLSRALRFAVGDEKDRMEEFKKSLYDSLRANLDNARKQEEENRNRVRRNYYESFLIETDQKVQEKNRAARAEQNRVYQKGVYLQNRAKTESDYKAAIAAFGHVAGFQDTDIRIDQCEKAIFDIQNAEHLAWENAEKAAAAKKKRTTVILAIFAVLAIAAFFVVTKVIIPEQQRSAAYQEAKNLYSAGDYAGAYSKYSTLSGYKDVDTLLSEDKNLLAAAREAKLAVYRTVGSMVTFGTYEQDNNTSNGKEEIEWVVLANEGNRSLLISHYGLDCQRYNTERADVTWENCSLRSWLNSTFLNAAFTADEQKAIQKTSVDNSASQGNSNWYTSGGNNTTDQIFLLSFAEAGKYFNSDDDRICMPTVYAKVQGTYANDSGKCVWWLRSPGSYQDYAVNVNMSGSLGFYSVSADSNAVRPAFWINLESEYFQ